MMMMMMSDELWVYISLLLTYTTYVQPWRDGERTFATLPMPIMA